MWSPFYSGVILGMIAGGALGAFTMALVAEAKIIHDVNQRITIDNSEFEALCGSLDNTDLINIGREKEPPK